MACGAWPIGIVAITWLVACRSRPAVGILKPDINPAAVARRPDAVRQLADRDGRDLREIVGAEHLDLVQAADRDIGEGALGVWAKLT